MGENSMGENISPTENLFADGTENLFRRRIGYLNRLFAASWRIFAVSCDLIDDLSLVTTMGDQNQLIVIVHFSHSFFECLVLVVSNFGGLARNSVTSLSLVTTLPLARQSLPVTTGV